jgi:hypothetical protein
MDVFEFRDRLIVDHQPFSPSFTQTRGEDVEAFIPDSLASKARIMPDARYKADIAGGSLKLLESRVIADLLLTGLSDAEWKDAIEVRNVLQKRSPATAKRQASLIKSRLITMGPDLWQLVQDGSHVVATHAVFACAVKHSPLLGDFLDLIVREQFRMFRPDLPRKQWTDFLNLCRSRDPIMPEWQDSTSNKLADCIYRILAEVGYIADTHNYRLQSVRISPEVLAYLRDHEEQSVLRCIQVSL